MTSTCGFLQGYLTCLSLSPCRVVIIERIFGLVLFLDGLLTMLLVLL